MNNSNFSQELKIQSSNGEIFTGLLQCHRIDETSRQWNMVFTSPVMERIETTNWNLFACLTDLRRELARNSHRPLCNGARRDMYLSGMCGEMGEGRVGYIIKLGEPLELENLVCILDYAEPNLVVSIEEQEEFSEKWLYPDGKNTPTEQVLAVQDRNGGFMEGQLLIYRNVKPPRIEFTLSTTPALNFECTGRHFFECLTELRKKLENLGYIPLCNGSRIDVQIFRFDIEVLEGKNVHILTYGKIPTKEDKLYIFDSAESFLVGSINEQESFYQQWLQSIELLNLKDYKDYGRTRFSELYFRLVSIGDLSRMWIFNIENKSHEHPLIALSPLPLEDVNKIGGLKGDAIIGFFSDDLCDESDFTVNETFVSFMHRIVAARASEDVLLQEIAIRQQEGWIDIVDKRASGAISSEDVIGSFEVKAGNIVANSYRINECYSIFGEKGLFQLTPFLYTVLLKELRTL